MGRSPATKETRTSRGPKRGLRGTWEPRGSYLWTSGLPGSLSPKPCHLRPEPPPTPRKREEGRFQIPPSPAPSPGRLSFLSVKNTFTSCSARPPLRAQVGPPGTQQLALSALLPPWPHPALPCTTHLFLPRSWDPGEHLPPLPFLPALPETGTCSGHPVPNTPG